jgi:hypothetical protein
VSRGPRDEPGSARGPDWSGAQRLEPAENTPEVVEGGKAPRRRPPHQLVVGLQAAGGVAVVLWAFLSLVQQDREPVVGPARPSDVPAVAREETSPLDPGDPGFNQHFRGQQVHGRMRLLMGTDVISFNVPVTPGWERPGSKGGWTRYGSNYLSKDIAGSQGAEAVLYWTGFPGGGWASLCPGLVEFPSAHSGADLAVAVSTVPGLGLVSGPSEVTVGGRTAYRMEFTVDEDLGCDPGYFFTWRYVKGGPFWSHTSVGDTITVWIVEREQGPWVIAGETTPDADRELSGEIPQIVDSIRFG